MSVSYYGTRPSGGGPVFLSAPRPPPKWSKSRPSPAAQLNARITAALTHEEVLEIFAENLPELDCFNACSCVSRCARICCRETEGIAAGVAAARRCQADTRWTKLLETVSENVRLMRPRELTMVAWGLAALRAHQPLLLKRIAWQAIQKLQTFEARTLANFTWALATLEVPELDTSMMGMQLYPSVAQRAIEEVWNFIPQELANILWAFATIGVRHEELFLVAALRLRNTLADLNTYDLGQTVWAFACLRLRDDALFEAVAERIKGGQQDTEHKPQNISNLIWAFAKVGFRDDSYYRHLARIAKMQLSRANPQDFSNVLWSLATVRVPCPELTGLIASKAVSMISSDVASLTGQEIGIFLWSFARLDEFHGELVETLTAILLQLHGKVRIGSREIGMALWALERFGRPDASWRVFRRCLGANALELTMTAFSTMLCSAARTRAGVGAVAALEYELEVWEAIRQRAAHPFLAGAVASAAALQCWRYGAIPDRARGVLHDAANKGATPLSAWRWCVQGEDGQAMQSEFIVEMALPPILPRCEGMSSAELYAKELDVIASVDARTEHGNVSSALAEIERWVELSGNWLKLAGGDKGYVLDRLVLARRPRLVVEVGFYVGYSSTRMAQHLRAWGGRLVSIEVDPIHAAIGQVSTVLAGLQDVVEVWVGHSQDVLPRLLEEFGPGSVDFAFFDQKGTIYHEDLDTLQRLGLLADGSLVVADNVLKPGAPHFLWNLHHSPCWELQIVSLREFSAEAIEDWMSIGTFKKAHDEDHTRPITLPNPPRHFEVLSFETDAMRWRAMSEQLSVADWARFAQKLRRALEEQGISSSVTVDTDGTLQGLTSSIVPAQQLQLI